MNAIQTAPTTDFLLTPKEAARFLKVSIATFYRESHKPDFPRAVQVTQILRRWRTDELRNYAAARQFVNN
jgi:predicted DNA-binding transcriptional regulator AlpA